MPRPSLPIPYNEVHLVHSILHKLKLRKYRLYNRSQDVDLCKYEDEIIDIINEMIPSKHITANIDLFAPTC